MSNCIYCGQPASGKAIIAALEERAEAAEAALAKAVSALREIAKFASGRPPVSAQALAAYARQVLAELDAGAKP